MGDVDKLYYKYGSKISTGVAELLYDKLVNNSSLGHYFQTTDIHRMQEHMAVVLCELTGGPLEYKGRDLKEAHKPFPIGQKEFDIVIKYIFECLKEVGVEDQDAQDIVDIIQIYRPEIVNQ